MARIIFFICSVLLLSSCVIYDANIEQTQEVAVEKAPISIEDKKTEIFSQYQISPGDQLDVFFSMPSWEKEAEYHVVIGDTLAVKFLNAEKYDVSQKIRPDGKVSLPFIGDFEVAGKSPKTIREQLTTIYADVFNYPEILVVVPEYLAQLRELKADLHNAPRGLSRIVTVRPDGYATFPLIGEFEVSNKTLRDLTTVLNQQYAKINPSIKIDLFLENHTGSVFYTLGAVMEQGAHQLTHPLTIIEALALAKGKKDSANIQEVIVYRTQDKKMVALPINLADMLALSDNAKMFFIYKDDIIYVPETGNTQFDIFSNIKW